MVAIRGGTGIKVCGNSDLQEPLLVDEEPGCVKVNPYRDVKVWHSEFLLSIKSSHLVIYIMYVTTFYCLN